jgi:hypothetical protein
MMSDAITFGSVKTLSIIILSIITLFITVKNTSPSITI